MRVTIKELKDMRKKTESDSFYVDYILRNISLYITKLFLYFPITPNMATTMGIFITIAATILFAFGDYTYSIIASFLILLAHVFDCVDGEIARCKKISSVKGSYYDDLSYTLIEILPVIGLTIGLYNRFQSEYVFYAGLSFLFSISFLRIVAYLRFMILFKDILRVGKQIKSSEKKDKEEKKSSQLKKIFSMLLKPIRAVVKFIFKLDGFTTILIIAAIFDRIHWVLFFYAVTYPILLLFTILFQIFGRFDEYIEETISEIPFDKFK